MASPAVLYQAGVHGSRPANGSGCVLYSCTTHDLVYRDDGTSWTTFMTLIGGSGGDIATDAIWATKGDLAVATANDTAAVLAAAANGGVLITASGESTGLKWRLNNDGAAVAPTVNEDSGDGYQVGSRWLNTTSGREYVCVDATAGAAVWIETGRRSGGVVYLAGNEVKSATAFADSGLLVAILANRRYRFHAMIGFNTAVNTTGIRLAINGPASPTSFKVMALIQTGAGGGNDSTVGMGGATAYDTAIVGSTSGPGATNAIAMIHGVIENGANAGNLVIRHASEVGGSNTTIESGSFLEVVEF